MAAPTYAELLQSIGAAKAWLDLALSEQMPLNPSGFVEVQRAAACLGEMLRPDRLEKKHALRAEPHGVSVEKFLADARIAASTSAWTARAFEDRAASEADRGPEYPLPVTGKRTRGAR